MPSNRLKLNEALLLVNKINISDPIEVYHQLEECFGCPLDKLKPQNGLDDTSGQQKHFVIETQHNFHLEIHQLASDTNITKSWCRLDGVALNSYGHYSIDVSPSKLTNGNDPAIENRSLRCVLNTIDPGECLFCPLAILACILFAIVAGEQIYTKLWLPGRKRAQYGSAARKHSSSGDSQPRRSVGCEVGGRNVSPTRDLGDQTQDIDNRADSCRHRSSLNQTEDGAETIAVDSNVDQPTGLQRRVESLDIFRGITIAGMIFVNYGGAGYAILEHKAWDGITLADFVFPFFIFSMGASIAIAARSMIRRYKMSFQIIASKICRRAFILALLGICLNSKWVNYEQSDGLHWLRLTGVLQRFSISYLIIALMYTTRLLINRWIQAQSLSDLPYLSKFIGTFVELLTGFNYVVIHVYLTFYFEFDSNCPTGYIGPGGQTEGGKFATCTGGAAAWIDRLLLGSNHMYDDHEVKKTFKTQVQHDPEGILGYTTSILLTLIGLQCGKILISSKTHKQKIILLGQWSIAMALASSLILVIPINKRLWSLTFVTITALAAFITIILLYVLVDIYSCKRSILVRLLSSAGKNSIFLYVGHSLIFGMLPWWFPIGQDATHSQLLLRLSWSTLVWLLIAHYMASQGLFIRV